MAQDSFYLSFLYELSKQNIFDSVDPPEKFVMNRKYLIPNFSSKNISHDTKKQYIHNFFENNFFEKMHQQFKIIFCFNFNKAYEYIGNLDDLDDIIKLNSYVSMTYYSHNITNDTRIVSKIIIDLLKSQNPIFSFENIIAHFDLEFMINNCCKPRILWSFCGDHEYHMILAHILSHPHNTKIALFYMLENMVCTCHQEFADLIINKNITTEKNLCFLLNLIQINIGQIPLSKPEKWNEHEFSQDEQNNCLYFLANHRPSFLRQFLKNKNINVSLNREKIMKILTKQMEISFDGTIFTEIHKNRKQSRLSKDSQKILNILDISGYICD
jgi:hypothetical protein